MVKKFQEVMGPLYSIYQDPDTVEICIDSPDNIYYENKGKIIKADISFESNQDLQDRIIKIFTYHGKNLTPDISMAEAILSDGNKISTILPPVSVNGPLMVIKKMYPKIMTWEELIEYEVLDNKCYELIKSILTSYSNILLAGNLGSGKTTLANLLVDQIPKEMRVVIIESDTELKPNRERYLQLSAKLANLNFAELINHARQLISDYLVINPIEGSEAYAFLHNMYIGQTSIGVIHADGIKDALQRLEILSLTAQSGIGIEEIRQVISNTIKYIIYMERSHDGKRRITKIAHINGQYDNGYQLETLMSFNIEKNSFEITEIAQNMFN